MLPDLVTERLVFHEVRPEDGPELQEWENSAEHVRFQATELEEYVDGTLRIERYIEHRGPDSARRIFVYVARCRETGAIIGQFGLTRLDRKIASLGFGVASNFWRRGYGTEISNCALSYGFDRLELHRISADVAIDNAACHRVMEHVGMALEGVARDCIWAQGRWWTEAKYAILATDRGARSLPT